MTNTEPENTEPEKSAPKNTDGDTEGIADEQLPEDLRPSEDNPLAEPLENRDDAHSVDDLDMQGGKTPEGSAEDGAGDDTTPDGDGEGDGDTDGDSSGS